MRLVRARHGDRVLLARLDGEHATVLAEEAAHPCADVLREALAAGTDLAASTGAVLDVTELTVLAPVANPSKILAIGLNYADHAREAGIEAPKAPIVFGKGPNSLLGPGATVTWRAGASTQVDYEAELAVVVGTVLRDAPPDEALRGVLGYTAANDVSARDAQFADGQWLRAKNFDGFCPLGPVLVTADEVPDPQDLRIACRVNGQTLQDSTTAEMIFGVAEVLSYVSRYMTLVPGDVVLTGTPHGVGFARTPPVFLADGDLVEVEIERIGVLANPVRVDAGA